ncbi:hypothetical protein EJ05DRAFT_93818 [Pseudovirgaria hyperparasitica]|uniref:Apple domain-containing protein n=1 Tax=Pseudovirgaria hyperparasitica TaxID=470096 RepID=A0A6A6W591_9PEZI|nr:uncharacterized protein EJ05DRAFT_93818 [Pseudovirgaria hyperparasitica]KAF2756221.1 hypothetical protein EJ05DRAFT_93818 [Pseudovirgaria hyperparasitica]
MGYIYTHASCDSGSCQEPFSPLSITEMLGESLILPPLFPRVNTCLPLRNLWSVCRLVFFCMIALLDVLSDTFVAILPISPPPPDYLPVISLLHSLTTTTLAMQIHVSAILPLFLLLALSLVSTVAALPSPSSPSSCPSAICAVRGTLRPLTKPYWTSSSSTHSSSSSSSDPAVCAVQCTRDTNCATFAIGAGGCSLFDRNM